MPRGRTGGTSVPANLAGVNCRARTLLAFAANSCWTLANPLTNLQRMKIRKFFAALIVLLVTSALADTTEYSATEAAKHVGETATVTDKVERANQAKGGNIFLNMGGRHPNETFTIFIPADAATKFADFKKYEGATLSVTGRIATHGDKPEITVNSPDQITIKEGAPSKNETPAKTEAPTPSPSAS